MVAAKASAVTAPTPGTLINSPARRRGLGPCHDHMVEPLDLPFHRRGGGQQRRDRRRQLGPGFQGRADPRPQLARAPSLPEPLGKRMPKDPRKTPDRVLRSTPLTHQMTARPDDRAP